MDLLAPSYGLIAFQAGIVVAIMLLVAAWIMIAFSNRMDPMNKLVWLIVAFCLPIIGPIFSLIYLYRSAKHVRNHNF